jgi:hypothetical protein
MSPSSRIWPPKSNLDTGKTAIYGGSVRDRAPDEPYTRWFSARTRRSTTRSLGSTGRACHAPFLCS